MTHTILISGLTALLTLGDLLVAQDKPGDPDTTPHSVRFVAVDEDVKLEVLDWGGSGRPIILVHGGNRTAHDFDKFASKLTGSYHVYGITRRGAGGSGTPPPTDANYSADRFGDDVLAVMNALALDRPVLVGHSLGGQELSSVGSRHPEKVAGLIYLEAAYSYAFYDRSKGFLDIEVNEVRRKLEQLEPGKRPADPRRLLEELLQTSLPELERTLRQIQERFKNAPPPQRAAQPRPQVPPIEAAIYRGSQRYTDIQAPALAIYAFEALPRPDGSPARAAAEARNQMKRDQAAAFEGGVPSARVVRLENASHDVFRSNESEVLREIDDFIRSLPKPGDTSKR
jgi:pimeloyl-ACP methyl ester carboxylesterase